MNGLCTLSSALCVISAVGGAAKKAVGGAISDTVSSAWQQVCQSFADAASQLLQAFAKAFAAIPDVSLTSPGIKSVYGVSMGIAVGVAALLLIGQVIRTAFTHDGTPLATGLAGLAKAALASLLTLAVATAGLAAADEITTQIIEGSFGSTQALSDRLGTLMGGAAAGNPAVGTGVSAALLLVFGVLGIAVVIVLWFELLLRNAAIAVLIATSPIAAAGQLSETTRSWWSKLVGATIQLIILKPVIALVFAVGLGMAGKAHDVETLLAGMLVLVLAVFAWPAVARFFAFASVQVAGGSGVGALLGFAAGRAAGGGGVPAGIEPSEFSRRVERRMTAGMEDGSATAGGPAPSGSPAADGESAGHASGTSTPAGAGSGKLAAGAATAGTAGLAGVTIAGARVAQRAVNSLTGRMEQMAGHAGIQGANPYAQPAGTPRYAPAAGYRYPRSGAAPANPEPEPAPIPEPENEHPPRTAEPESTPELIDDGTGQFQPPSPPVPPRADETRTDPPPSTEEG